MVDSMAELCHLSKKKGSGGRISGQPGDFRVEEITEGGPLKIDEKSKRTDGSGEYSVFILQKTMWSTQDALQTIAKALGVPMKRLSVAGNKDRNAVTVQLASCWGMEPAKIRELRIKDITILGCWTSDAPVKMGDLAGNRFSIRLADMSSPAAIRTIMKDTAGFVPNYFGPQRFGLRGNNPVVGKLLVEGKVDEAAMEFICGGKDESKEAAEARRIASEDGINERTLKAFPNRLRHERTLMRHLIGKPEDYVGALRELPRNLLMIFVHSYQSRLFNLMLSERIRKRDLEPKIGENTCGLDRHGFINPEIRGDDVTVGRIVGYDSKPTEDEEDVLWKEGIETANFRIRRLPELSARGFARPLLTNVKGLKASGKAKGSRLLVFELPKGSYATSALRELTDVERT